jgi:hypothetical protein
LVILVVVQTTLDVVEVATLRLSVVIAQVVVALVLIVVSNMLEVLAVMGQVVI